MSASYRVDVQDVNVPDNIPADDNVGCCIVIKHTLVDCKNIIVDTCCPSRKRVIKFMLFVLGVIILGLLAEMRSSMATTQVPDDVDVFNVTEAVATTETALWTD